MEKKENSGGFSFENYRVTNVDLIDPAPWNYKEDHKETKAKLRANMKEHGQIVNVILRNKEGGRFEMVNGNHRLEIMQEDKVTECMSYHMGTISDTLAMRVAVETNETSFPNNPMRLGDIVSQILETYEGNISALTKTFPFSGAEVSALTQLEQFDWNDFQNRLVIESKEPVLTFKVDPETLKQIEQLVRESNPGEHKAVIKTRIVMVLAKDPLTLFFEKLGVDMNKVHGKDLSKKMTTMLTKL